MVRSRWMWTLMLVAMALLLASCAAGVNPVVGSAADGAVVAGFWRGAWHGIIAPITFFISLFTDEVSIYEVHNRGNWYDFGFVLGAGILWGGSKAGGSRRS
jgi:hypothetical protein